MSGGILILLATTVSGGCSASTAGERTPSHDTSSRPNILFILTDQHRWDCVGAYGNEEIRTPHIDRIAAEGVRFDRSYAAQPVCSPNRSSILTGMYPHTTGVWENCKAGWEEKVGLPRDKKTLAEILAPAGYDCGYFGKWHLGRRDAFETMPEYPSDGRGDQHYFGKGQDRRYGVDVITGDAIAFIRQPRNKPFYIYVSFYPPHPPYSAPPEYVERYRHIENQNQRVYYAMCEKVDEKVGEMLSVLDEIGVAGNTMVIFTSDHGHNFDHRWNHHDKRLCYDTSARLPLVMRMPGVIAPRRATDGLISSVDLVPTMLSLIGRPIPRGLEGRDLSDLARGRTDQGRPYVFIENIPFPFDRSKGEERCVFDGRWKLILSTQRAPELYDLANDPAEVKNLWDNKQGDPIVDNLVSQLEAWGERTDDKLAPQLIAATRSAMQSK